MDALAAGDAPGEADARRLAVAGVGTGRMALVLAQGDVRHRKLLCAGRQPPTAAPAVATAGRQALMSSVGDTRAAPQLLRRTVLGLGGGGMLPPSPSGGARAGAVTALPRQAPGNACLLPLMAAPSSMIATAAIALAG